MRGYYDVHSVAGRYDRSTGGGMFRRGGKHSPRSMKARVSRRGVLIQQLHDQISREGLWPLFQRRGQGSLHNLTTAELLEVARDLRAHKHSRVRRSR
jgi:hypothetical protein